ncbi:hypothetical protein O6H91_02G100500 [Diphasiastrum complanatum]|uniref:Uncharacterized protein n=1 Tax=Diphasiastrum complanatum TaxID=34168 RepID=A0ACC2EIS1_DIPCM|nr:hypothetical protein O6H91_02G100500 [Diphasiastrum complanatum]
MFTVFAVSELCKMMCIEQNNETVSLQSYDHSVKKVVNWFFKLELYFMFHVSIAHFDSSSTYLKFVMLIGPPFIIGKCSNWSLP